MLTGFGEFTAGVGFSDVVAVRWDVEGSLMGRVAVATVLHHSAAVCVCAWMRECLFAFLTALLGPTFETFLLIAFVWTCIYSVVVSCRTVMCMEAPDLGQWCILYVCMWKRGERANKENWRVQFRGECGFIGNKKDYRITFREKGGYKSRKKEDWGDIWWNTGIKEQHWTRPIRGKGGLKKITLNGKEGKNSK